MIFHKHKLVFVGIPKNASHAPLAALSNKTDNAHDHSTYMQIYHEHDEELLDTYTSFAIVRNPYSRTYSCWNYLSQIESLEERFGISTFLEYVHALESRGNLHKDSYEELTEHELTFPQSKFISFKGTILVDKVLRYETLDKDWKEFVEEHNKNSQFKVKNVLRVHNSMEYSEPDWTKVYTPEMYSIVNEFYKKDFELFDYEIRTK